MRPTKAALKILLLGALLMQTSGCGLLIAGGIAGGMAIKRRSARNDAIKAMKASNDRAAAALAAGDKAKALSEYLAAESALFAYTFKYARKADLTAMASEHPEVARTGHGLLALYTGDNDLSNAAAISRLLPRAASQQKARELKLEKVAIEAAATAPHMYAGTRAEWHGEVIAARHDAASNMMQIVVVPYTWQRRQVGLRSERYYDSQLKIYRHRLVPSYRTFKIRQRHRRFMVQLGGYQAEILPGRAATFLGEVGEQNRMVALGSAVPTKILDRPGGRTLWYLGVAL